jgi:hypothetical protein
MKSPKLPKIRPGLRRISVACLEEAAIFADEAGDEDLCKDLKRILRRAEKRIRKKL